MNLRSTYTNPVYPSSFPDPYVLKFRGEYFAYCTGLWSDGRVFGVLRSRDLVNWREIGGAMSPLEDNPPFYWAPEVTYDNGKFYLYYSAGNETFMEIRVAVSDRPDGGFTDSGKRLTSEEFAIDAHIFTDDDGTKYLFYATDFLRHTHIGTGTVMDEMIDQCTLAGKPRPITRAKYDWQIYDPNRKEKGGVRWHTVEGPFVLKRKGLYYQMFSGGNWKNVSYGVSFAVSDDIKRNEEWSQFCDGKNVLPILRTIPGLVDGPGHNSVIRGPDNRELYCIYHRWVEGSRVLAIDRMDFAGTRIFVKGATYTPQIAPLSPAFTDNFETRDLNDAWETNGQWQLSEGQAISNLSEKCELIFRNTGGCFLCEVSLRVLEDSDENSGVGLFLSNETEKVFEFIIFPRRKQAEISWSENGKKFEQTFDLAENFVLEAFHLLRLEIDGLWVKLSLDENVVRFERTLESFSTGITLRSTKTRAAFAGFALTKGFEDRFDRPSVEIERSGWESIRQGICQIKDQQLFLDGSNEAEAVLFKGEFREEYAFTVNLRLVKGYEGSSEFGFLLLENRNKVIMRLSIVGEDSKFYVSFGTNNEKWPLPLGFVPEIYNQFSFFRTSDRLILELEGERLGEISLPGKGTGFALFCRNSIVAFDMVRVTVL